MISVLHQRTSVSPTAFLTEWVVGAGNTIALPLVNGYGYNFTVNWGDGSAPATVTAWNDANATHTYTNAGTYRINIDGICQYFMVNNNLTIRAKIRKVLQWGDPGFTNFENSFNGCYMMDYLPTEAIIDYGITSFASCFLNCNAIASISSNIFANCTSVTTFSGCFASCTSLAAIPADLFLNCSLATDFSNCFNNCSNLISIASGAFDGCVNATTFYACFSFCTSLNSVPSTLFDNCLLVTTFELCFFTCTSLVSIPSFTNNTAVTTFVSCFEDSTMVNSIPTNFIGSTIVTTIEYMFRHCTGLITIGAGAFTNLTNCLNFSGVFDGATSLQSIPATLFDNCLAATDFDICFRSCTSLTGNAPDLWNRIPAPTGTDCYKSDTGLANYASIPAVWK